MVSWNRTRYGIAKNAITSFLCLSEESNSEEMPGPGLALHGVGREMPSPRLILEADSSGRPHQGREKSRGPRRTGRTDCRFVGASRVEGLKSVQGSRQSCLSASCVPGYLAECLAVGAIGSVATLILLME